MRIIFLTFDRGMLFFIGVLLTVRDLCERLLCACVCKCGRTVYSARFGCAETFSRCDCVLFVHIIRAGLSDQL